MSNHWCLDNCLVLDLTRLLPGPYCSLILADLGATVVKLEQPGSGDPLRQFHPVGADGTGVLFGLVNRGKKGLSLDLKTGEGREIALRLASKADVMLESFRPGVMERLGLDYPQLAPRCPQLVYASISGYGQHGPLATRAGHDVNYCALGGLLDALNPADASVRGTPLPLADLSSALWATIAVLAALHRRNATGHGEYLDLSILDGIAALALLPYSGAHASALGVPEPVLATDDWACYGVYRTQDGRLLSLGALEEDFWKAFCTAVAHPEWCARQFAADQRALKAEVAAELAAHPLDYWRERLTGVDCCCEPVLSPAEALAHPQLRLRGFGRPGWAQTAVGTESAASARVPALGADNAEILGWLGYNSADVRRLDEQGVTGVHEQRST